MERCNPSSSAHSEVSPPVPLTLFDETGIAEGNDIESPLMEKKIPSAKPTWLAGAADLFILLCSFLLTTASMVLVALVFHTHGNTDITLHPIPTETLSILQRVISTFSLAIASAVIMVAGKRYVLFKLAREGLRSRRVAVYSNASIGNLVRYWFSHGMELPSLGLSAVWGLALVTGLTVNSSWEMGPTSSVTEMIVPSGPLGPATPNSSWVVPASEQLTFVMSSLCLGIAGTVGLINVTGTDRVSGQPMGIIYYPPLLYSNPNTQFSFSTTMNGFNISMEQLSYVPPAVRNQSCVPGNFSQYGIALDGSDNQTLSLIVFDSSDFYDNPSPSSPLRLNVTALVVGGTLSSTGNYTEFALNGTSWPSVMPTATQWAQDITNLICGTICPSVCDWAELAFTFSNFASELNTDFKDPIGGAPYPHWSTVLGMSLGAYSSASMLMAGPNLTGGVRVPNVPTTVSDAQFTLRYGTYILILNIIVSLIMIIIVVGLCSASHLGPDFINATRLLLDPLKEPELFNASLERTLDVRADPYMRVRPDHTFVLAARDTIMERRSWIRRVAATRKHAGRRGTRCVADSLQS